MERPVATDAFTISAARAYPSRGASAVARLTVRVGEVPGARRRRPRGRARSAGRTPATAAARMSSAWQRSNATSGIITFSSSWPPLAAHAIAPSSADHLVGDHREHLGHRRVHLPGHDRRARLHRREPQLAEAGVRAAPEEPHVAADPEELERGGPERAGERDERRERLHRVEEVRRRRERDAGEPLQLRDDERAVARVGVEPGADRGPADAEQRELRQGVADAARRGRRARPPSPTPPARAGSGSRP